MLRQHTSCFCFLFILFCNIKKHYVYNEKIAKSLTRTTIPVKRTRSSTINNNHPT